MSFNETEGYEYWIDQMIEKHECFPYRETSTRTESLVCDDRAIRLVMPEWVPEFEVVEASFLKSGLLFLLLKDTSTTGFGAPLGAVVLAQPTEDGRYSAVMWHSTYPGLLKRTRLSDSSQAEADSE